MTIIFTISLIFKKDFNPDVKEHWFCGFKSIGYTILAILIYEYYKELDKIPVLNLFTFVLAAFEGGHNFVNSFSIWIACCFKLIFKRY